MTRPDDWPALILAMLIFFMPAGCVNLGAGDLHYASCDVPVVLGNRTFVGSSSEFQEEVFDKHSAKYGAEVEEYEERLYGKTAWDEFGREGVEIERRGSKKTRTTGNHRETAKTLRLNGASGIKNLRIKVSGGHFYFFLFGLPWISYDWDYVDFKMEGECFKKNVP